MSRQDPGAANADTGQVPREPGRCVCGHLEPLHTPGTNGRTRCSGFWCECRRYTPKEA